MRISTSQMHTTGVNAMLDNQTQVHKTQMQLSSGRRILTPADDPSGANRMLQLSESVEITRQYQRNADAAQTRLSMEESTLASAGNILQRVRELAVQANNPTLATEGRQAIAKEVRELRDQLLALANTRDGSGEYLFAGYQVNTQPFIDDGAGGYSYAGDSGLRMLQIGPQRQVTVGDDGARLFMNLQFSGGGMQDIFTTLSGYADTLDTGSGSDDILNDLDVALGRVIDTRATVGARLNAIEGQQGINDAYLLEMERALSEVRDLDYAEAVSRFNQQMLALQAAQQTYAKIQSLSLFNYIS